jgi:hypothetical protein
VTRGYDKVAESKMQFRKMKRKANKDADELDFEKEFGFPEDAVLTRVERQCGGGRIPEEVSTFGQLSRAAYSILLELWRLQIAPSHSFPR